VGDAAYASGEGYETNSEVVLECQIQPSDTPYTLIMTTFDVGKEAKFSFSAWFNTTQGNIELTEFATWKFSPCLRWEFNS